MSDNPFISVVMPVRNEGRFIERSLRSVLAQDYPRNRFEVIVADGMSDDDTRETIGRLSEVEKVRVIDNPRRIVATGLNLVVREAKGDIIVRVDGHCEIASDYLRLCATLLEQGKADCVGGPLETIGETISAQAIAVGMSSPFGVGGSTFRIGASTEKYVDTVAFPAYKRDTLQRVGEFDEELVRNQDDEYNYRLRKLGGKILLSPEIRARYYSRATFIRLCKQYFQYGYWKVRVMQKHPRQMQPRQFVPAIFVLWLFSLAVLSPIVKGALIVLFASLAIYGVTAVIASVLAAARSGWRLLPLLPFSFLTIHVSYGFGFLMGLIVFWNRWERSDRAKTVQTSRDAALM